MVRNLVFTLAFATLLSLSTSPSAHAFGGARRPAPPVPCNELQQLMEQKISQDFKTNFNADAFQFKCPSPMSAVAKMFYDMYAPSQSPGAPDFYGFVRERIKSIEYIASNDKPGVVADANYFTGHVRLFAHGIRKGNEEYNSSTLYHEARHLEKNDPSHVKCTQGYSKGSEGACDETFFGDRIENGSGFHYDVRYMNWVLTDEAKYDKLDRDILKAQLRGILLNRFNTISKDHVKKWLAP